MNRLTEMKSFDLPLSLCVSECVFLRLTFFEMEPLPGIEEIFSPVNYAINKFSGAVAGEHTKAT